MTIVLKLLLYIALLFGITQIVPGVTVDAIWPTLVIAGLVFYIVNTIVKPVLKLLTLPVTIITLGLFSLVVNAFAFWLVGYLVNGFDVNGVLAAVLGSIAGSVGAWIISALFDKKE